ncbi:histidine kinase [Pseudonocardia kujensis]|uniref:sensor histidine kinase n=1 Tax=Pseudonocardia kujensis TaxID=1128675 RepID=UPI001E4AABFA|nr:histidine kinase [Pseudonocardia kujensis]MCE0766675.1 histidine kinase [Pseudonocardia kujensis]
MILDAAGPGSRPSALRRAAALVWLPIVVAAAYLGQPRLPVTPLAIAATAVACLGWVVMAARIERPAWDAAGLVATAAGGCVLSVLAGTWSTSVTFCFVAVGAAGARLSRWPAVALTAATSLTLALTIANGELVPSLLVTLGLVSVMLIGMSRRDARRRAEEQELARAAETRATEEHARAAALAERARIARDLHDVLAHSLSALAVQLQGARLMLQRDGAPADTVAQVERAHRLATEGLAEARRAVHALRSGPVDLPTALRALAADHPGATLDLADDLPEVSAEALDTLVRTTQEALSNARRHAPGAPVTVRLGQVDGEVELEVTDVTGTRPDPGTGGYGLVGMAERAALVGARLDAGPTEDGWRVRLTVPVAP